MKEVCRFIEQEAANYPVKAICSVLGVDKSSYYRSLQPLNSAGEKAVVAAAVEQVFWRHARRYGLRRIQAQLQAEGLALGRHQIRRLMKEQGLKAI